MGNSSKLRIIFLSITIALLTGSCATINSLMGSGDEENSEAKKVSLDKRLQISIPIPENSMYLTDKTVIFGEGDRFTGVLYLVHDAPAEEIVEFYRVEMRDDGWMELAIVRSNFILMNFDKEDRFACVIFCIVSNINKTSSGPAAPLSGKYKELDPLDAINELIIASSIKGAVAPFISSSQLFQEGEVSAIGSPTVKDSKSSQKEICAFILTANNKAVYKVNSFFIIIVFN